MGRAICQGCTFGTGATVGSLGSATGPIVDGVEVPIMSVIGRSGLDVASSSFSRSLSNSPACFLVDVQPQGSWGSGSGSGL